VAVTDARGKIMRSLGGPIKVGHYQLHPDWGQIAFASALAAWIVWYYFDAYAASPNVQNMLLIRPVTCVALIVYLVIVYQALNLRSAGVSVSTDQPSEPGDTQPPARGFRAPLIAAALVLYVAAIPYLGFDISTTAFIAAAMAAAGERRLWVLAAVAIGFAALLSLGFKFALSTPVPTLVL
jgi:Tripartite tricarboxylate transporter TctB family